MLDTNVLMSGIFFGGVPGRILAAWRDGLIDLVVSTEILDEYRRVGEVLSARHREIDVAPILRLLTVHAEIVPAPALAVAVCSDPDDDKFLACAIAAQVDVVVTGDRDLLACDGWQGVRILDPRRFSSELPR